MIGEISEKQSRREFLRAIGEKINMMGSHPDVVEHLTELMLKCIVEGRSTPGFRQKNDRPVSFFFDYLRV